MIERYTLPKMKAVWEDKNRFKKWLDIEILACEAQEELGNIPAEALSEIKTKAKFNLDQIEKLEKETDHELIAFLTNLSENVGKASRFLHLGLTSSDIMDTALFLQMKEAAEILIADAEHLVMIIRKKAFEHKNTLMIGRTHGVQAEPTTFGLKLALWVSEMERNFKRLRNAQEVIAVGKISGAVGTYATLNPKVESYICQKLGLEPAKVSSQILQRDRHAEYMTVLALVASSLEKFATEIRNLQRTEILEVEEPFKKGQKGSSAMPHKRNPIICERICGLARVIRANALTALENVALWHERDISHSSAERVIIPDSTILLDYILTKFSEVMDNLIVYPENMKKNLEKTGGLIFSQRVLLALIEKDLSREEAYELVQKNATKAWQNKENFKDLLLRDAGITKYLSPKEVEDCFDPQYYLRNIGKVFERFK